MFVYFCFLKRRLYREKTLGFLHLPHKPNPQQSYHFDTNPFHLKFVPPSFPSTSVFIALNLYVLYIDNGSNVLPEILFSLRTLTYISGITTSLSYWLAEKNDLIRKQTQCTHIVIYFLHVFQRKPDIRNMANNGSERKLTTFKIIYNFKK